MSIRRSFPLVFLFVLICSCAPTSRYSGDFKPPVTDSEKSYRLPVESKSRIDIPRMYRVIAKYMSVPYQNGGTGTLGLDCSGLAYVIYRDYDSTRLPLTVRTLWRLEKRVEYDDLTYGDLIFFKIDKRKVSHVGIYLNEGKFLHASKTRGVAIDNLTEEYWAKRYCGARRIE